MQQTYKKKVSQTLDEEFQKADQYGVVKIGEQNIFWRRHLRWYYLPAQEVKQVYRQIEQVDSYTSCCETDFSIHRLFMILQDDSELSVLIGDSLYRREPELLMETIAKLHPHIVIAAPALKRKK